MSDTPPSQKEAGDAPAAPKNSWVGWLVWVILAPVLYVLSCGPVSWLIQKHYLYREVSVIYQPLNYLSGDHRELLSRYIEWWRP